MAYVVASASITVSTIVDVKAVERFYFLGSSMPDTPTAYPPVGWQTKEPAYEAGSDSKLYYIDCVVFVTGKFKYSDISTSAAYDAINGLEVTGRNLIRNSVNLLYRDYKFE